MSNVWAAKNPDKWREYKRKWQAENRDKQAAYRRDWDERNPNYYADNKDRGLEFSLALEDVVVPDVCPLLGTPLSKCDVRAGPNSPSLDRKNNDLGYVKGNVWVISRRANIAKNDLSLAELELLVVKLRRTLLEGARP